MTGKDEGMKHLLYIRLFLIKIKPAIFSFFFFGKFIFHFLRVNTLLKKQVNLEGIRCKVKYEERFNCLWLTMAFLTWKENLAHDSFKIQNTLNHEFCLYVFFL